ncbi:hypothetical protein FDG2_0397 [Candidatus Protofrankia californiensis]|uniref:Transposase n=1 Tax=Candidatus Protofrankia californiensis TaxID=1839754 RepID=A0A1C3NTG4_9ACTN|nr:hypothetical protein FDG2_0397 [Candidatus Protofrankia californiensis]
MVRWYLRYALSYRDLEELLAERGLLVDHVTVLDSVDPHDTTSAAIYTLRRLAGRILRPMKSVIQNPLIGRAGAALTCGDVGRDPSSE